MKTNLLAIVLVLIVAAALPAATIYGLRVKNPGTPLEERLRWQTTATEADVVIPGHGTVHVAVEGEQLILTANGDADGGRDIVIRSLVVNQARLEFRK